MYFSFDNLQLRYEPYPIGIARPLMDENIYREFLDNFPPLELFRDYKAVGKPGNKYTLSEKEDCTTYNDFIRSRTIWRDFHRWLKDDEFAYGIMDVLREHHIDLGFEYSPPFRRLAKRVRRIGRGEFGARHPRLRTRFEFSALPADGGHLRPHTDSLPKVVTMIVSMVRDGEWNAEFGGGTDVNRVKDTAYSFNRLNRVADFGEVEVVDTFSFCSNQGVIFIKTFNSWHSVRPMTGKGSSELRKTLTINIEAGV